MTRRIINVLIMNNETWALRARSIYEQGFYDKTILIESRQTFSGEEKPLYYERYRAEIGYKEDHLDYEVVDVLPFEKETTYKSLGGRIVTGNRWPAERFMRNAALPALARLDLTARDIVVVQDVDEIANIDVIRAKADNLGPHEIHRLSYLDYRGSVSHASRTSDIWYGGYMICAAMAGGDLHGLRHTSDHNGQGVYWQTVAPEFCRNLDDSPKYPMITHPEIVKVTKSSPTPSLCGWHLSNMTGGFEPLTYYKLRSFAHAEFDEGKGERLDDYVAESEAFFASCRAIAKYDFSEIDVYIPVFIREMAEELPILFRPLDREK